MHGYFKTLEKTTDVPQDEVDAFRERLMAAFDRIVAKLEANHSEFPDRSAADIPDTAIRNAIRIGASPDDVVWAWLT